MYLPVKSSDRSLPKVGFFFTSNILSSSLPMLYLPVRFSDRLVKKVNFSSTKGTNDVSAHPAICTSASQVLSADDFSFLKSDLKMFPGESDFLYLEALQMSTKGTNVKSSDGSLPKVSFFFHFQNLVIISWPKKSFEKLRLKAFQPYHQMLCMLKHVGDVEGQNNLQHLQHR